MASAEQRYDYDWLVIGSGFGGSVSALRLAEKGYSVGVLECGRRFADNEFPKHTGDVRRYFWSPKLGMKGIFRLTPFKDVSVVSGCGVGGGSLGYACTLYVPPKQFFEDRQWAQMRDWETSWRRTTPRRSGCSGWSKTRTTTRPTSCCASSARSSASARPTNTHPVGIYFGTPGKTVPDPFFGGEGPDRTGCHMCGRCMVGCVHGAKNTLVKNYLWFAERLGALRDARTDGDRRAPARRGRRQRGLRSRIGALRRLAAKAAPRADGARRRPRRRPARARTSCCSAAASAARCPRVSSRLGELVRTNSESILTVTVPEDYPDDLVKRVAITSSIYPDPNTHIETVTYGDDGDSMRLLYTLLTGDGTRVTRPLKLLGQILRHPGRLAKVLFAKRWSRRTIIILVMQTLDNAIALRPRKGPVRLLLAADRTGPRAAEPDVHPGRQPGRGMVRQANRRHRAELVHGGDVQHPLDRPHPRRRGDRRRPERRRRRRRPARLRLREPARLRRLGDPGQRRASTPR